MAEDPVPRSQDHRHRGRVRPQQRQRALRRAVGSVPQYLHDVERRSRQRTVQDDRRRRSLGGDLQKPGHAERHPGQDRHRRLARRQQPRVRADRGAGRRDVPFRRRGRHVEEGERQPRRPAARVLLHAGLRGSERQGHVLRAQRRVHEDDGRGKDVDAAAPAARRHPRYVDRSDQPEAFHSLERRQRHRHEQRRADLDRPGHSDRAVLPRHYHERRAVSRLRRAAGQHDGMRRQPVARRLPRADARRSRRRGERRSSLLHGGRRRKRLHRAGSEESGHLLRGQLRRTAHAPESQDARAESGRPLSR